MSAQKYTIVISEETRRPVLMRHFDARTPGAMSGAEIIAPEEDFREIFHLLAGHFNAKFHERRWMEEAQQNGLL